MRNENRNNNKGHGVNYTQIKHNKKVAKRMAKARRDRRETRPDKLSIVYEGRRVYDHV